jgi:MoxR-like ATPase
MTLAEHDFVAILKQNIRPAQPIDSPELLQGRSATLRDIGRALHSPGMHVFIHGERGIGKTSIALTAAKAYFRADPPWVGCDENSTFEGIVGDVCRALLDKKYVAVAHVEKANKG